MSLEVVRRKGRPNLYIRGTVRGQSVFESTGTSDAKAAEQIRIRLENRLLEESIHGKTATVTFEEAVDAYVSAGGPTRFLIDVLKDGTKKGLVEHFRGRKLTTLGQADLDLAALKLFPKASPETRNRQCYTPFIAVWTYAVRQLWADKREWSRPRKPKGTTVRPLKAPRAGSSPVDYETAAAFVRHMSPAPAFVLTTLFFTGMRPIELFALQSVDVNVAGRWLVIRNTKTGEPRGVPVHEFITPLLEVLAGRGGALFRTPRGEPYPILDEGGGQLKTAIAGARRRSGIKGLSPYTARHTVSTQLVVAGVHPHMKDQILGHAVDDMSRRYTNVPQAPLIEAINKLPVSPAWRALPWLADPLGWEGRLAEGTGRRTDLLKKSG